MDTFKYGAIRKLEQVVQICSFYSGLLKSSEKLNTAIAKRDIRICEDDLRRLGDEILFEALKEKKA